MPASEVLAKFAESHQLRFAEHVALPREGNALGHDTGQVEGSAAGKLPGGIDGTLAHFTYSYTVTDADDHTHTVHRRLTVVVTQAPESIGFVPSLGFAGSGSELSATGSSLTEVRSLDLGDDRALKDARAYVYKGSSENWVTQLFSPALLDWLARSPDDFGFELSNGVLCVARNEYLTDAGDLETLCNDAAHIAGAIREEALEETAGGDAAADAAKALDPEAPKMEEALAKVAVGSPSNVAEATPAFAGHLRSASTFFWALGKAALITLVLNVPGAAIPILLIVAGNYAALAAIEAVLIAILLFFIFRKKVREGSKKFAAEAFFRAYAKDRELTPEEPLHFAATHAEAKLPFKPDRVFSGPLPSGVPGALALVGDGSKRSDRIAVVGGPKGPIAESELESEPPGISAKDLDVYLDQLSGELKEAEQTAPVAPN
jgi:hypothetical protein